MTAIYQNVVSFVCEYWYWCVAGIILLPAFCWQMLFSIVFGAVIGFQGDRWGEEPYKYKVFWRECVRQGDGYISGWKRIFVNKFTRLVNLGSLYWAWGWVLLILAYADGTIVRWIWKGVSWFFKGLWKLISAGWKAL